MAIKPGSRPLIASQLLVAAAVILGVQGILTFSLTRPEYIPSPRSLSEFPVTIGSWQAGGNRNMDSDAYTMLAPDDYLDRTYFDRGRQTEIGVFIAYYNSQHKAKGAHDPSVCLPGSGWDAISTKLIQISTPRTTFAANYMLAAKGDWKDVVVYWYQLNDRTLTGDEGLHLRRIFETFRENRTDMALVRIVVPVTNGQLANATESALDFVRSAYSSIMVQFPPESH